MEEREIHLQVFVDGDPEVAPGSVAFHTDDAGAVERPRELRGALEVIFLTCVIIVAAGDEPADRGEVAARGIVDRRVALQKIDQHPRSNPET